MQTIEKLKEMRDLFGITNNDLARRIGIKEDTFGRYMRGVRKPRPESLKLMDEFIEANQKWMPQAPLKVMSFKQEIVDKEQEEIVELKKFKIDALGLIAAALDRPLEFEEVNDFMAKHKIQGVVPRRLNKQEIASDAWVTFGQQGMKFFQKIFLKYELNTTLTQDELLQLVELVDFFEVINEISNRNVFEVRQ